MLGRLCYQPDGPDCTYSMVLARIAILVPMYEQEILDNL